MLWRGGLFEGNFERAGEVLPEQKGVFDGSIGSGKNMLPWAILVSHWKERANETTWCGTMV